MGYAFISYSSKNQAFADAIRELFKKHNIDTWMAPYDIPAGSKYASVITKAIRDCSCFVLLLSNDSQASEAVDSEIELATLTFKKSIITIELEKVILNDAFTFYIHNKQIIAVHKIVEDSDEIKKVLNAVSTYTNDINFSDDIVFDTTKSKPKNDVEIKNKKLVVALNNTKRKEISYCSPLKIGDIIRFGQYKQADYVEDISWTVLDIKDEQALIISNKTIDCQPFIVGNQKANWQQSHIRRWLNNIFYLMAFSKEEQDRIPSIRIDDELDETGCVDSYDKVLLLTCEEAVKYFKSDEERLSISTGYAASLGATTGDWWLKSGYYCDGSYDEFSGGEISWCNTYSCYRGVKPCLWIKL